MRRFVALLAAGALFGADGLAAQDHVYFGNLHSHTSYSDGSGTPRQAWEHARDVAHLDFMAITEHNHARAEQGARERRDGLLIATDPALYTGPAPSAVIPAAKSLTEDGRFIALYGQEFSTINSGNHANVFEVDEVITVQNGAFAALAGWLDAHPDPQGRPPIVQFNHPADFDDPAREYGADDFGSTAQWVRTMGRYAALIELLNGPGLNPTDGHPPQNVMPSDYLAYLNLGFHLAPTGDQDNHYFTWGTLTEARTGVIAPALTRQALLDALRARHVYATEDRNLEIIARVNGHLMGDILTPPAAGTALDITVAIRDADEPDADYRIEIFQDAGPGGSVAAPVEIFTVQGNSPDNAPYRLDGLRFLGEGQYLFLKVTQTAEHGGDDRAWTAPVWFESGAAAPGPALPQVRITSLLPDPSGDDRLAEEATIRNTGTTSVNLNGWLLQDAAGQSWPLAPLGSLGPGAEKTIRRNAQPMSMNNGGDTIVLVAPGGAVVQSVTYGAVNEGERVVPQP